MSFHSQALRAAAVAMVAGLAACATQDVHRDAAAATPVVPLPELTGSTYSFTVSETTFAADGPTGRVTGLAFRGRNLLSGPEVNNILYGSTFWTSPQTWPWPPAIDAAKWTHRIDTAGRVVFDSGEVRVSDHPVSVEKRFWGDGARNAVVAEYTVTNRGNTLLRFAPWQVTRVAATGVVFYPRGAADPAGQTRRGAPRPITAVTVRDGIVWYDFSGPDAQAKSVGDGAEGWLAYVADGVLLLHTFEDIPAGAEAEGEGEIEVYSAPNNTLVELEPQGAAVDLAPGATSAPWRAHWYLRAVPEGMDVSVGSKALVDWVRTQLR